MNFYDIYGWHSETGDVSRDAGIAPDVIPATRIAGDLFPNWTGHEWIMMPYYETAPYIPSPAPTQRILTKLEYMNRFTDAELAGIYTAAKTVISVEIWLEKFKLATEINLDDPATIVGLQAMEAGGLLAAGRSAEILV